MPSCRMQCKAMYNNIMCEQTYSHPQIFLQSSHNDSCNWNRSSVAPIHLSTQIETLRGLWYNVSHCYFLSSSFLQCLFHSNTHIQGIDTYKRQNSTINRPIFVLFERLTSLYCRVWRIHFQIPLKSGMESIHHLQSAQNCMVLWFLSLRLHDCSL